MQTSFVARTITALGLLNLLLAACGPEAEPKERIEYYIEDDRGDSRRGGGDGADGGDGGGGGGGGGNGPGLSFVSPSAPADADGEVTIEVSFARTAAGATWSAYYTQAAAATSGGTAIAEAMPVATTTLAWDTADVPEGTYYVYAVLKSGDSTTTAAAGAAITVSRDPAVNRKPTVSITFPNGENVFVAGAPKAITWNGRDADGDALTAKLEYSADNGATWTMIADAVTESSYMWDVAGLTQGIAYKVRVTVSDGNDGGTATAMSAKAFGVATQPMTFAAGFGAMLTNRCAGCHAQGRANAAQFRSDNFALATIGVDDKQQNIKTRIEANTMPPGAPLGAADKAVLTMWLWDGAQ